jgi:filamentous hemagglutinin family protein
MEQKIKNADNFFKIINDEFFSFYSFILENISKKVLPFWFYDVFTDNSDLSKALIQFFKEKNQIKLSDCFSIFRNCRNIFQHNKFMERKFLFELYDSLEYIKNILNVTELTKINNLQGKIIEGIKTTKNKVILNRNKIIFTNDDKIEFNNLVLKNPAPVIQENLILIIPKNKEEHLQTNIFESENDLPVITSFYDLKQSKYRSKFRNGQKIIILDGALKDKECTFFKWNGNLVFVIVDGVPKSLVLQRRIKILW